MIEHLVNQLINPFTWRLFFGLKRRHRCRSFSLRFHVYFG